MNEKNDAVRVIQEVRKAVYGKDEIIYKIMLALLAGGHVLIEDIPGVGKTTIAQAFATAIRLQGARVQMTPDVLPSDLTGTTVLDRKDGDFRYRPGVAMCNLLLADEINRTSSKTQSALLEVMEEGQITVDGETHAVPQPFHVIATQNPIGSAGTMALPENQLDRFLICLSVGYPKEEDELRMLQRRERRPRVAPVIDGSRLLAMQQETTRIYTDEKVLRYIIKLARRTREHRLIKLGLSPRGELALMAMARAAAYCEGRDYVIPEDIQACFTEVAAHRMILHARAFADGVSPKELLTEILQVAGAAAV